jgi:hypothetical protein
MRNTERKTNMQKNAMSTSYPFPMMYLFSFFSEKRSVSYHICITVHVSVPLLFFVFSHLWKEIFHKGKAVYGNMWEFFLCFYFAPYTVNIPKYVGGFKQVK